MCACVYWKGACLGIKQIEVMVKMLNARRVPGCYTCS